MEAYLWSTNDGNASWIINGRQAPKQGTKLASGKSQLFLFLFLFL